MKAIFAGAGRQAVMHYWRFVARSSAAGDFLAVVSFRCKASCDAHRAAYPWRSGSRPLPRQRRGNAAEFARARVAPPVRVALERLRKAFAQKRALPVAPAFLLRMDA
jgi:hypothetical protein